MKRLILSIIISFSFVPSIIHAQFSLKPKPLPDCKTFLITEIGYFYRVNSTPEGLRKYPHNIVSNLGFMVNLSDVFALGATTHVSFDTEDFRGGFKIRGRRWLSTRYSVDLSMGLILWNSRDDKNPGISSSISFSIEDKLILEILVEIATHNFYRYYDYVDPDVGFYEIPIHDFYRDEWTDTDVGFYTGIKTGSGWKPGFILNVAVITVSTILLGAWVFSDGD
jgi:hypothetical protein